jgi:hypothetical protein
MVAVAVAALAPVLAGCSGDGNPSSSGPAKDAEAEAEAGHVRPMTLELDAEAYPALQVDVPERPIATAPSALDEVTIEVYVLRRQAGAVTLVLALHNTGSTPTGFNNTSFYAEEAGGYDVSELSLLDAANRKLYLTYRQPGSDKDSEGPCLCSSAQGITSDQIDPGERAYLAALFPAPPDTVDQLTVQAGFGAVPGVGVTDA